MCANDKVKVLKSKPIHSYIYYTSREQRNFRGPCDGIFVCNPSRESAFCLVTPVRPLCHTGQTAVHLKVGFLGIS